MDRQEGDSACVKGLEERCWMRFLKGMVTDRNRDDHSLSCYKTLIKQYR
jgi:hypothetical protein